MIEMHDFNLDFGYESSIGKFESSAIQSDHYKNYLNILRSLWAGIEVMSKTLISIELS